MSPSLPSRERITTAARVLAAQAPARVAGIPGEREYVPQGGPGKCAPVPRPVLCCVVFVVLLFYPVPAFCVYCIFSGGLGGSGVAFVMTRQPLR